MRVQSDNAGFSIAELVTVVLIVAIASAVAVPYLLRIQRIAAVEETAATVLSAIRRAAERAATTGRTTSVRIADYQSSGVVMQSRDVEAPAQAVVADRIEFQAGTGYPRIDGQIVPAAVLISSADGQANPARAIVVGRSATITEYDYSNGSWKERNS